MKKRTSFLERSFAVFRENAGRQKITSAHTRKKEEGGEKQLCCETLIAHRIRDAYHRGNFLEEKHGFPFFFGKKVGPFFWLNIDVLLIALACDVWGAEKVQ